MKVLVLDCKNEGPALIDASTPEKEEAAYLCIFKWNDRDGYYNNIDCNFKEAKKFLEQFQNLKKAFEDNDAQAVSNISSELQKNYSCKRFSTDDLKKKSENEQFMRRLKKELKEFEQDARMYEKAKAGDMKSAKWLIETRTDNEYENVYSDDATDPVKELEGFEK